MTTEEIEAKAFGLISAAFGEPRASAILRAIATLETVADVTTLRRLWQASARTAVSNMMHRVI